MTAFLLYLVRSGLYLGLFYAFYLLVMRRTTFFRLNRTMLLGGSLVCALLPFLRIRTAALTVGAGALTLAGTAESPADAVQGGSFSWPVLLLVIYGVGALAVLLFTAVSTMRMYRLVRTGEERRLDGYRTFIMEGAHPSFSVGKCIVISRKDLEEHPVIFAHETQHVRCRHYLDLLVFRLLQTVWWWNPLVWVMRTELGLLHEYEADEGVISKGIDATQYQLLLVRKAVGEQRFSLASGFQHAQLKNRISMMLKPSSNGWMRLSYLALIPLLAVFVYACNPSKKNKTQAPELASTEAVAWDDLDTHPGFGGGDANEFSKWVNANLDYPESAKDAGVQGRLVLQFTIDTDGSMKDIKVLRGLHPDLDAEALRVLNSCPGKWTPGTKNGQAVKVTYTFPVVFQLR